MPTLTHESLVNMFRMSPEFAADVLGTVLGVAVPAHDRASVTSADLSDAVPIEFRADLVIELWATDASGVARRVLMIVTEPQLGVDADKPFTWPAYAAVTRARFRCPVYVLAVTIDEAVARWASSPIEVSPGLGTWRPLVFGPPSIPRVTAVEFAQAHPELAVLSALVHANDDAAGAAMVAVVPAALGALDAESARTYLLMLRQALRPALRTLLEATMIAKTPLGEFEVPEWLEKLETAARRKGAAEALAQSLLTVLRARGLALTEAQRERVVACEDPEALEQWLRAAVTAATTAAVFRAVSGAKAKAKRPSKTR